MKATRQNEIDDLLQKIKSIQDEIRLGVALQLKSENSSRSRGWTDIVDSIEKDKDLYSWLNW